MLTIHSQYKCFNGMQITYSHHSALIGSEMRFGVFIPPQLKNKPMPVLYWLSGLTCTEENFMIKAGAQRVAAELGLMLVIPDTSPRGLGLEGEKQSYDLGEGAGFYVDATQTPWSKNYKMYSYITQELPQIIHSQFHVDEARVGILGHSMGGHGALTIALKNPHIYKTVSAFSPICSAIHSPWGEKAFSAYLGHDKTTWEAYDACELISTRGWQGPPILVDQGTEDAFLEEQLKPSLLEQACQRARVELQLRLQTGYDHSYYFIATFIEDHLRYHSTYL
ncbi:S-formylglutathione hydrolase [Candidatus Berkiella aquae]|uniref:S-formylglutathione hydrolase n=1 Tax=Candidatus Berkiella aquae TaxID=295108 RepID=A0A0Q9YMC3_9GAMM|nr:S-formylglutathione hydrolase [Candidatus Berkiella aquae]